MSSGSSQKYQSDRKQSPFSLKSKKSFVSMIKQLIKTQTASPSNLSREHAISNIKAKMNARINLQSHKASLSNVFSSNSRKETVSPIKGFKRVNNKKLNEAISNNNPSSECLMSYDHPHLMKEEAPSMCMVNKCSSYSDLASLMNLTKIQRLERKLSTSIREENAIANNTNANKSLSFKRLFDIYIEIFDEVIKLTHSTEQGLLNKIKKGFEIFFSQAERAQKELEEEAALYKTEVNRNKTLCEKYSAIIKEYQKKTQETDYKIQFNNHLLIDDNDDTDNNCLYDKTQQVIINKQSCLCSRNQGNPVNKSNVSKEFSTNELESICFADKVTMIKMNSLLNIPKLNFQNCKQKETVNLSHQRQGE